MKRRVSFSDLLFEQVVGNCLDNAGDFGQHLLKEIAWKNCVFSVLEVPGIDAYPLTDFLHHIIPQPVPTGVCRTPDNAAVLIEDVAQSAGCFFTRELALDVPHKLIPARRALWREGQLYYAHVIGVDDIAHLNNVVRLSQSWTFFGFLVPNFEISDFESISSDQLIRRISAIYFQVYSGDTYLEAKLTLSPSITE